MINITWTLNDYLDILFTLNELPNNSIEIYLEEQIRLNIHNTTFKHNLVSMLSKYCILKQNDNDIEFENGDILIKDGDISTTNLDNIKIAGLYMHMILLKESSTSNNLDVFLNELHDIYKEQYYSDDIIKKLRKLTMSSTKIKLENINSFIYQNSSLLSSFSEFIINLIDTKI